MKNLEQFQSRYDNQLPPEDDYEEAEEVEEESQLTRMQRKQVEFCEDFDFGFGGID